MSSENYEQGQGAEDVSWKCRYCGKKHDRGQRYCKTPQPLPVEQALALHENYGVKS